MNAFHVAVIPVGKVESDEVEAAMSRAAKVLRAPVEVRDSLPVPQGVEDTVRRQFRVANLLARLRSRIPQLGRGKLVGADDAEDAKAPPQADVFVFITDVDMFTAKSDGVFAALNAKNKVAIVSLRRLREAFYRRKPEPTKHRARLIKETLRMVARVRGLKECSDPRCALAPSKMLVDVDTKEEAYCRNCSEWLFEGTAHI
ncbi:MAG: hypothetical protein GY716_00220 [bacterium]|nr:hypothetical protein [bacterium]